MILADLSTYQDSPDIPGHVDFAKMRNAGIAGVILKTGQRDFADADFTMNYAAAKAAGLPRGAYWFYDSRSDPAKQAELFIRLVNGDRPELGMWLDIEEDNYRGDYAGWKCWQRCLAVLDAYAPLVGIYTGPAYWLERRPTGSDMLYFRQFPLWIANYKVSAPLVPLPWSSWVLWQYTAEGDGLAYGVESKEIDLDKFNGSEADFERMFGVLPAVPTEQPTMTQIIKGTVITTACNIRQTAGGDVYNPARYLHKGDRIEASEHNYQWLHLSSVNGVPADGWASAGATQQYITWEWVNVTPPVDAVKTPFTLTVNGYKPYSGELEKA